MTRIARGLVDRGSVDRYLQAHRQGRTRAWAAHTAWGAVAILSGRDADWLGATQASRLRSALREVDDVDDLLTQMRDRAQVHDFDQVRELVTTSTVAALDAAISTDSRLRGVGRRTLDELLEAYR